MTLSIIDNMIPILLSIIRLGSVGDREYYDIVRYRYDISYTMVPISLSIVKRVTIVLEYSSTVLELWLINISS